MASGVFLLGLGVAGCATAPAPAPLAPRRAPRTATLEEVRAAYDRYSTGNETVSASGDLDVRDLRAGRGRKLGFRLVAARGGKLYLKGSIAIVTALEVTSDGKIATTLLPKQFFAEAGATPEDTEGIVNYGRSIDGVVVSALLKEIDEKTTRVSLRAKPGIDVQAVATMFGGGGHKAASGCTMPMPLAQAKTKLVSILQEIV